MRLYEISSESFGKNPHYQFHMSVEPDLVEGKSFAHQIRTISTDGERGNAGTDGNVIYTTLNLQYWATQFFYEEVENFPEFVYLVYVEHPTVGSTEAAHQDANHPSEVTVLKKIGRIDSSEDSVPDYGKFIWLADKFMKNR